MNLRTIPWDSSLYPALAQDNVTVLVNTQVNRVILERNRAVGVECAQNGQSQTFGAHREVILSTGGFNTPKLLMLSGIGDEAQLRQFGIPVHVHSPNVGENVQDHVLHGGCLYEAPEPFVYNNSAANVSGYYKTDSSLRTPDIAVRLRSVIGQASWSFSCFLACRYASSRRLSAKIDERFNAVD